MPVIEGLVLAPWSARQIRRRQHDRGIPIAADAGFAGVG
jgi:hypothetical protein